MKITVFNLLIILCFAVSITAQKIPAAKNPLVQYEKSIDEGKLAETERDLFNYVIANPSDAKGFALLGKLRLKQNRLNEAKSLTKKALTLDSKLVSAKLTLAATDFQNGETEQAKTVLDGIADGEITNDSARLNFAQTLALVGDCPKVLATTEKLAVKIKNSDALPFRAKCYLQNGDRKNFALLISLAKSAAKTNSALALQFVGVLYDEKMFKETVELLSPITVFAPKNIDVLILLAKAEIALKNYADAKIHLAQAEKLQPASAQIFLAASMLEDAQGNNAKAFELLEKSLAINSADTEILQAYIIAAIRANQPGKAFQAAEKLLELQPENPGFLYLYGAAALQNNKLSRSESSLEKFMNLRPNDSRGCLALGLTFAAQPDKIEAARGQMQKCLTINPNNFEATYQLGLSYKTQGETAKAVEYLEQTVKISPDYAAALRDLGAVYLLSNQEEKARVVLEKSVALNPNDADTHFQLSRLYNIIGQTNLAKKHLEIFQKLKNPKKDGM